MSKKDRKRGQPGPFTPAPDTGARPRPATIPTVQAAPDQPIGSQLPPQEAGRPDYSRRYFLIFWIVMFFAAAVAWILAIIWPGVSESTIERWMMAALAVSLAVFLFFYK